MSLTAFLQAMITTITCLLLIMNYSLWLCECLRSDVDCLKSMKESLLDPHGYLDSTWKFNNPTEGFICGFTGVECWHADESKVLNIKLVNMGLVGEFPRGIAGCSALTGLDLSNNLISGAIPSDISKLLPFVTSLDLSGNRLAGEIPVEMTNLSLLSVLKLDNNRLSGRFPPDFGLSLRRLKTFSVANNRLSGPVPDFQNDAWITVESYANNQGLCGGPLEPCINEDASEDRASFLSGFAVAFSVATAVVFALSLLYVPLPHFLLNKLAGSHNMKKTRRRYRTHTPIIEDRKSDIMISTLEKFASSISLSELARATDNFAPTNVIGIGETATIYKATLQNGSTLAIKKFWESPLSEERFMLELKMLGRLRHANIVPLVGFCYERKDRLLVYKCMPNGSLHDWLHHPKNRDRAMELEWPVRVRIAVGLARGLAWLHHNPNLQLVHGKICSRSILLDQNFEPKISNFRKAKIINPNNNSIFFGGSFIMNGEPVELNLNLDYRQKDVYCFGVVLLELITAKEPRKLCKQPCTSFQVNLAEWITNILNSPAGLYEDVDESLEGQGFDDQIVGVLNVALKCVQPFAGDRPTMIQVYETMSATGREKYGLLDDTESIDHERV